MTSETLPQFDDDSVFVVTDNEGAGDLPPQGAPSKAAAPKYARKIHPLNSIRRHKGLAVVMMLLVAAAAVPVFYFKLLRPVFSTEATLGISPVLPKNLIEDREFQIPRYDEFVNQQMTMMTRQEVTLDALDKLGEKSSAFTRPGEGRREAADRLSLRLTVKRVPSTTYVALSLEAPKPDGLADIINAVVDSYLSHNKGQSLFGEDNRMETLTRHRTELQEQVRMKTEALAKWAKELGVSNFDSRGSESDTTGLERAVSEARGKRIDAESRLSTIDARQESQRKSDAMSEVRDLVALNPELTTFRQAMLQKRNELRAKLIGLTAEHTGRKGIEGAITEIDTELEQMEKSVTERVRTSFLQRRESRMKDERLTAESDVLVAKRIEENIAAELAKTQEKAGRYNGLYYEVQSVRQDMERLNRQLAAVEDRVDLLRMENQGPGLIQLVAKAQPPDGPVRKSLVPWIALFVLMGAGAAIFVPCLVDATDTHVRSVADIELALEGRPLGWVLERRPQTEAFVRDQLRRLALSLDRERRLYSRAQFVFTSLRPGGGTSRLVLDIARELKSINARVVVIEANALHPDPRLAPADGQPGLAAVLAGDARIEDAILPGRENFPDLVPIGDTQGSTVLAGCRNLHLVLDKLMSRYEIVLIDAPPILFSSDAELLTGRAHATILVVDAEKSVIGEVKRAIQIIRQVGPPLIQAILNRVRDYRGHGYYSDLIKEHEAAGRPRQG